MINLRNSPFLWFALLLLLAYWSCGLIRFSPHPFTMLCLWGVCLICSGICLVRFDPGKQLTSTFAIALLIFSGGIIRVSQFRAEIFPGNPMSKAELMAGTVIVDEVLKEKETSVSIKCRAADLRAEDESAPQAFADKYVVLQIRGADSIPIYPGDMLKVKGWVSAINGPLNPHSFDVRAYYKTIGIRHQMNCKGVDVTHLSRHQNSLMRLTAKWQSTLCGIVSRHTTPEVAQLTNALVWGDRTYMNEEIRDAFANSGAMHVLSVSGMHMAMIYSMLHLLLGAPGSGTYFRRMTRLICYATAIILYMGLTGACPAVVRSGLMILLYLLGKAMGWNTQIWNLLGFAAFLMLWINPFVWHNIGFQLSFLAMAGILLYAKPMIRYLSFKQIILHRIWEISAVSIAAQVFILPLLLHHFFQFPLTFIASSLVAMPASYVIIFGSLLNICLSFLEWQWLWDIYDLSGQYFILSMKWMAGLNPDMNFSLPSAAGLMLMAAALLFSIALVYEFAFSKKLAYATAIAAVVTLGCHRSAQWSTNELIVYHQYKGLLIDLIIDGRCISLQDSSVDARSISFAARGNRCYRDIIHTTPWAKEVPLVSSGVQFVPPCLHVSDATMLIWKGKNSIIQNETAVTHLLVDQAEDLDLLKTFICLQPELCVILPAHLKRYPKNILAKFLRTNEVDFWDISEQGYFRLDL